MLRKTLLGFLVLTIYVSAENVLAQTSDPSEEKDLDVIEAEIKNDDFRPTPKPVIKIKKNPDGTESISQGSSSGDSGDNEPAAPEQKIEKLSDLSKLQPFSEVSVLQRRYMPKTGRMQIYGGVSDVLNDPWNTTAGLNLRVGYGFTESWGIELAYFGLSSSASQAAQNLYNQTTNHVSAQSFGQASGFTGAFIMWTPIYGKLSFSTDNIVPFDMYFTLGGGSTSLSSATGYNIPSTESGGSFGTGQIYAVTRSIGFRWDLTWNVYSLPNTGSVNNLLLTVGANWYFPEATYR